MNKVSIIIPCKTENEDVKRCVRECGKLSYKNVEIIVLPDTVTGNIGPAEKRDLGAAKAKGEILAFIDDDAYPSPDWISKALPYFDDPGIAAAGGPGVTPPDAPFFEQVSGWVLASPLGAGPYTYRFIPQQKQDVDDYPSMNLIVRKKDFDAVGGFDSTYYPGEDTKLCLDLVHKRKKRIVYDPDVLVYHRRRPVLIPHLKQQGNYGLHRGHFARILPKTSLRISYVLPSILVVFLVFPLVFSLPLALYSTMLVFNAGWIAAHSNSFLLGIISIPGVFATHLWYGIRFIQGYFFTKKLDR